MTEQKQTVVEELESRINQKFESEQESLINNMNAQVEEIRKCMESLQKEELLIGFLAKSKHLADEINKLHALNRELGESFHTQATIEKLLKD